MGLAVLKPTFQPITTNVINISLQSRLPLWDESDFEEKDKNYYDSDEIDDDKIFQQHYADAIRDKIKINNMIIEAYESDDFCKITRFILGINTGFRDSDLRNLRVRNLFNSDGTVKNSYACNEIKTGKPRQAYLNNTVKKALTFLVIITGKQPNDYLFTADKQPHKRRYVDYSLYQTTEKGKDICKTNEKYTDDGKERTKAFMETSDYNRWLKKLAKKVGMDEHCSSHCQRQTYSWWIDNTYSKWEEEHGISKDDTKMYSPIVTAALNHSSSAITDKYYNHLRHDSRIIHAREFEMNLGKAAVDTFIDNYLY